MTIEPMTKYVRNQSTVASKLDDELVMIDVDLGKYFSMNPVASSIWECIETPKSINEISETLLINYSVDEETCTKEVKTFLSELMSMKLVDEIDQ